MNTMKRMLAIVLSVCMVCAFIVPVASAETQKIDLTITSGAHSGSNLPTGTVLNDGSTTGVGLKYLGYSGTRFNNTTYVTVSAAGSLIVPLKVTGTNLDVYNGWVALEMTNVPAGNYTLGWWSVQNSSNGAATEKGLYDVYVIPTFDYSAMDDAAFVAAINALVMDDYKVQAYDFSTNSANGDKVMNIPTAGNYIVVAKLVGDGSENTHASRAYFSAQHLYLNPTEDDAEVVVKPMPVKAVYSVGVDATTPALGDTISAANAPILNYIGWNANRLISGNNVVATAGGDIEFPLQVGDDNGDGVYDVADFGDNWVALELKDIIAGKYTVTLKQNVLATGDRKNYAAVDVYAIPSFDYSELDAAAVKEAINAALADAVKVSSYDCSSNEASNLLTVNFEDDGDYILVLVAAGRGVNHSVVARNYIAVGTITLDPAYGEADVTVSIPEPAPEPEPEPEPDPDEIIIPGTSAIYKVTPVDASADVAFKTEIGAAEAAQQLYYLGYSGTLWGSAKPGIIDKSASDNLNVPLHADAAGSGWLALEVKDVVAGNYTISFWSSGGTSDKQGGGAYDIYAIPSFDYSAMDDAALVAAIEAKLADAQKVATYDFSDNTGSSEVVRFANDGDYIIIAKLAALGAANTHGARAYFRTLGVWLTGSEEAHTVKVAAKEAATSGSINVEAYGSADWTAPQDGFVKFTINISGASLAVLNGYTPVEEGVDYVIIPVTAGTVYGVYPGFDVMEDSVISWEYVEADDEEVVESIPSGSELALGDNNVTLSYATMPMMAPYWTYTATENGYLTVTVVSINGNADLGMGFGRGMYTLLVGEADGAYTNTATVYMNAGDSVNIAVLNSVDMTEVPAVLNLAFATGDPVVEETPDDYFEKDDEGNYIIETLADPLYIFSGNGDVYYIYIAEADGAVILEALVEGFEATNCAVKVNDGDYAWGADAYAMNVNAGDVVIINVWGGFEGVASLGESVPDDGGDDVEEFPNGLFDIEAYGYAEWVAPQDGFVKFTINVSAATIAVLQEYTLIEEGVDYVIVPVTAGTVYSIYPGVDVTEDSVVVWEYVEADDDSEQIEGVPSGSELPVGNSNVVLSYATVPMMAPYWYFTATEGGYLTVTVESINGDTNLGMGFGMGMYTLLVGEADSAYSNTATIYLNAGDSVNIAVLNAVDMVDVPAVLNLVFIAGEPVVEESPDDYFEKDDEGNYIIESLADPLRVFSGNDDVYYIYVAESAGTLNLMATVDGFAATNCAVKVNDGDYIWGLEAASIVVNAGDVVIINVWAGFDGVVSLEAPEVVVYTVIFKDYNGNIIFEAIYNYGDVVEVPADPSRDGYVFIGWDNEVVDCVADAVYTAQYVAEGTIKYEEANGEITITGVYGNPTSLIIPNLINGVPVVAIGQDAFRDLASLVSVDIPSTIKTIGDSAFRGCTGLTEIVIPNSVTTVGYAAFRNCTGLVSVTIPDSVTNFSAVAFDGCNIENLTFAQGTKEIKLEMVFCEATLKNVMIPNTVEVIGDYAFQNCTALTNISIPNSVKTIGKEAFRGCTGLTAIDIPNSVISIGENAFRQCSGFTTLVIPSSVTSIGYAAFRDCTGLVSVTIPDSAAIGASTFTGCAIKEIIFAQGTKTINQGMAFCESTLESVLIPNTVTAIGDYAFLNCVALKTISIPNTVTSIGTSAFQGCTGLTTIDIPNSVKTIGAAAFRDCTGVTSINIPNSVVSFGDGAFRGCTALTSVEIPNSVESIGYYAFYNCTGLTSLTISDSVTYIHPAAFTGCSIKELIIAYGTKTVSSTIVVSKATLERIDIPSGVTTIGDGAFNGCAALTSIEIPGTVTSIGDSAFRGCTGLTELVIPTSVATIGANAFRGCTGLTTIAIPNGVKTIGENAFAYCDKLVSIAIANSVTAIEADAFRGCTGLICVFYAGSSTNMSKITIAANNDALVNAEWHCRAMADNVDGQDCYYCFECDAYFLANGEQLVVE